MIDIHTAAMKLALKQRITDYLSTGGLFNPELADHIAVRDLLIDCRKALVEQPAQQTIHCKHRLENNGVCPHHNLHCGWPKCNEPEQPAQQEPVATVYLYRHPDGNTQVMAPNINDPALVVNMLEEGIRAMNEGKPITRN